MVFVSSFLADNGWTLTSVLQSVGAIAVFYNNPLVTADFVQNNGRLKLNRFVLIEFSHMFLSKFIIAFSLDFQNGHR
jgi:hypothetical protein